MRTRYKVVVLVALAAAALIALARVNQEHVRDVPSRPSTSQSAFR